MNETLLKKVRRLEISTRRLLDDNMAGSFRSHFKGQGVQFSEHRNYTSGDDVRRIDWKVSARSREPLLKLYEEERELSVLIIADFSGSIEFGSVKATKKDMLVDLSAIAAYAAMLSGDKTGVIIAGTEKNSTIIPVKGMNHTLRIIRDLMATPLQPGPTSLGAALESARRLLKHTGVVFVISDFKSNPFEKQLKQLARKHDVVAIKMDDPAEHSVPNLPSLGIFDPELGKTTSLFNLKSKIKEFNDFDAKAKKSLTQKGVELLSVSTTEDYIEKLLQLFQKRKRR